MYWTSHDLTCGRYNIDELHELYELTVDHREYPDFLWWVWDMERSAVLCRHIQDKRVVVGVTDCPHCRSGNVVEDWFESHDDGHYYERYEMRCHECGAEWTLHYDDGKWFVQGDDDYEEEEA